MTRRENVSTTDEIRNVLKSAFGWALTKDRELFVNSFANDEDFFSFFVGSKDTVQGWKHFETYLERWMDPKNIAKGYDLRDVRIVVSKLGDTAWFSAVVDDEGEYDGVPWKSENIRWTGVLEKRGSTWRICQQHMSLSVDN